MQPTMTPTMTPENAHLDIPGNPSTAKSSIQRLNDRSGDAPLKVLSEYDWSFWQHNGYVVIRSAVPKEQVQRLAKFLWEFEEKDPGDPTTWYTPPRAEMQMKELTNTGMVEVYNHQYLWDNRQTPKVYEAFCDIWGTDKLWVTIDRANLNLPMRPDHEYKGFIHWDYDPETKPVNVQGVLALSDQDDENMGGFQCVPELMRTYDTWKLSQPDDRNHFQPDVTGFDFVKVKMNAGDLLIFNSLLPHGIRPNRSENKVRIAQYISMMPAQEENAALRAWRIQSWKDRVAPEGYAFPGRPEKMGAGKISRGGIVPAGQKTTGAGQMVRLTLLLLLIAGSVQGQVPAQPLLSHVGVARSYFKGKWHLFYHDALASGKTHLRNVKVTEHNLRRVEAFNPFMAYK